MLVVNLFLFKIFLNILRYVFCSITATISSDICLLSLCSVHHEYKKKNFVVVLSYPPMLKWSRFSRFSSMKLQEFELRRFVGITLLSRSSSTKINRDPGVDSNYNITTSKSQLINCYVSNGNSWRCMRRPV